MEIRSDRGVVREVARKRGAWIVVTFPGKLHSCQAQRPLNRKKHDYCLLKRFFFLSLHPFSLSQIFFFHPSVYLFLQYFFKIFFADIAVICVPSIFRRHDFLIKIHCLGQKIAIIISVLCFKMQKRQIE